MGERLKSLSLTAENMSQIYDVSSGQPVLHNTALQVAVSYCEGEDVSHQVSLLFQSSFIFLKDKFMFCLISGVLNFL